MPRPGKRSSGERSTACSEPRARRSIRWPKPFVCELVCTVLYSKGLFGLFTSDLERRNAQNCLFFPIIHGSLFFVTGDRNVSAQRKPRAATVAVYVAFHSHFGSILPVKNRYRFDVDTTTMSRIQVTSGVMYDLHSHTRRFAIFDNTKKRAISLVLRSVSPCSIYCNCLSAAPLRRDLFTTGA